MGSSPSSIIGSERLEPAYYGRLNLTKTASFKDTGAVFFSADERAELCERIEGPGQNVEDKKL